MRRATAVATVVLTPLVWPLGVLLLWLSPGWDRRSKLIGTFLLPGGLALAWFLETGDRSSCPLVSARGIVVVGSTGCSVGPTYPWLHPGPAAFNHVFGALVFTATLLIPIVAASYLALRLRSRWADL